MSQEQERVRDSVSGFSTAPLLDPPQRRGLCLPAERTLPDRVTERDAGKKGASEGQRVCVEGVAPGGKGAFQPVPRASCLV